MRPGLFTLLCLIMVGGVLRAQDAPADIPLIPYESADFALQALRPDGWTQAAAGVFARASSPTDSTVILIQSATAPRAAYEQSLAPQLLLDAFPAPDAQLITAAFAWDLYRVDINAAGQQITVSVALAATEADDRTYAVLLQSTPDDHDTLREQIFLPVVESVVAWAPEAVATAYTSEDVTFSSGDLSLAGTITIPPGDGPFPAVAVVSGSGPSLRTGSLLPLADFNVYTTLADHLSSSGIVVLRYDDRGVGESEGDLATATLDDLAQDASGAVDYLRSRAEVDPARVGLIGHSEGGIIIPQVAANNAATTFLIALAGPAVDMTQVIAEQNRMLFSGMGLDAETVDAIAAQFPLIQAAIIAGDDDAIRAEIARLQTLQTGAEPSDTLINAGVAQFRALDTLGYWTYDVAGYWQQVGVPALAIFGGRDTQVSAPQSAPALQELLGDQATIVTFEAMNHVLQAAETGLPNEYAQLPAEIMPEVIDVLVEWINAR
ncbi:MAG: alpha/beta hydrolase [Chloroflexi bacterium]|nr:alpha/beta hydrolase [Chloroflexota bacterium]